MRELAITIGGAIAAAILIVVLANLDAINAGLIVIGNIIATWLQVMLYTILLIICIAAGIAGYVVISKQRDQRLRQIDGAFSLIEYKRNGVTVIVDPNKMISGSGAYHPEIGWRELEPAGGWDRAATMSAAVQLTRTAQAIAPGDSAIKQLGTYRPPTIPQSAVNPRATRAMLRAEMQPPPVEIEVPKLPAPAIPAQQLISDTQPTRLALGQDVESGAASFWTLPHHPHVRIHGSTQSGKTALARFLVAQAIKQGYEVVIYDRRRGKDWGIFANHAELVDVRSTSTFIRHMQNEVRRYEERDALLGQNNAPNLEVLAKKTGQSYRRRLIVIEELGVQFLDARDAGKDAYGTLSSAMARLTSEAGATGIHGMYIDQMPSEWPKRIRYNCAAIVFHLPDHGGKVAGYIGAPDLPMYHCWFDDSIIKTGYMDEEQINSVIGSANRSFGDEIGGNSAIFDTEPPNAERTNAEPMDPAQVRAAIFAHLDANPESTQAEIRTALGSSKAWTNQCWHEWHALRAQD